MHYFNKIPNLTIVAVNNIVLMFTTHPDVYSFSAILAVDWWLLSSITHWNIMALLCEVNAVSSLILL